MGWQGPWFPGRKGQLRQDGAAAAAQGEDGSSGLPLPWQQAGAWVLVLKQTSTETVRALISQNAVFSIKKKTLPDTYHSLAC